MARHNTMVLTNTEANLYRYAFLCNVMFYVITGLKRVLAKLKINYVNGYVVMLH